MNATIRIKKVHLSSSGDVSLKYQEFNETTRAWATHSLSECEPPLDSLQEALDALAPLVRRYREEGAMDIARYSVTGLTFFYAKTEAPGAEAPYKVMIASHRQLDQWGPANCNTPRLQVTAEEEEATCVTTDEALKIEQVATEAIRYISGERKQVEIQFGQESGEDELSFGTDEVQEGEFEVVGGETEGGDA